MHSHDEHGEPTTPEQELEIAQAVLDQGDTHHAIDHLSWALAMNPEYRDARQLFDQIITRSKNPLDLIPMQQGMSYALAAARAYIHIGQREYQQGISLLTDILRAVPNANYVPWIADWVSNPAVRDAVQTDTLFLLLGMLMRRYPGDSIQPASDRPHLERIAAAYQEVHRKHPQDGTLAGVLSALLRRLGRLDEALQAAKAGYQAAPNPQTAVFMAAVYRLMQNYPEALKSFELALKHDPNFYFVRLDMGDLLLKTGQLEEAARQYQLVLDKEPDHQWAKPHLLYTRALQEPDGPWKAQLRDYASANPDGPALTLANTLETLGEPYITYLPDTGEAILNVMRQVFASGGKLPDKDKPMSIGLSSLESPSARLAVNRLAEQHDRPHPVIAVANFPEPDPRLPHGDVDFVLWRYDGSEPKPAVSHPAQDVADLMAEMAVGPYKLAGWVEAAKRLGTELGPQRLQDLLGVMVHPPQNPPDIPVWVWIYQVQVAAALVIAHLDDGWQGSVRRSALISLLRGPMDWTVNAAIIALMHLAVNHNAARVEVVNEFVKRLESAPREGAVIYFDPLITCWLMIPDLPDQMRQDLMQMQQI